MHVRVAAFADIRALFDVRTSVRENHMSLEALTAAKITPETIAMMLNSGGRGWVAEDCGIVVAFVMANAIEGSIFAMFVHPDFEKRGLGRMLMTEAEQWLFANGVSVIWLRTSHDQRIRAHGFYQHLGWTNQGMQEDGQIQYVKSASRKVAAKDR